MLAILVKGNPREAKLRAACCSQFAVSVLVVSSRFRLAVPECVRCFILRLAFDVTLNPKPLNPKSGCSVVRIPLFGFRVCCGRFSNSFLLGAFRV